MLRSVFRCDHKTAIERDHAVTASDQTKFKVAESRGEVAVKSQFGVTGVLGNDDSCVAAGCMNSLTGLYQKTEETEEDIPALITKEHDIHLWLLGLKRLRDFYRTSA